jgi:hypothetical protein
MMFFVPTLTDQFLMDAQVNNGYTLNLTQQGGCTSPDWHLAEVVAKLSMVGNLDDAYQRYLRSLACK